MNKLIRFYRFLKSINSYFFLGNNKTINFAYDSNINIKLPPLGFSRSEINFFNLIDIDNLTRRNRSEVLLRMIVSKLYEVGFIDRKNIIIDSGSWIGDNALIWSRFLVYPGKVISIDPSERNLMFQKKIADFNNIENIDWIKSVLYKIDNHKLSFSGKINHTQFFNSTDSKKSILSSTIDTIINNDYKWQKVGFIHLDVEGLEYEVLTGSINTLKNNLPLIIFEHHLKDLDKFIEIKFYLDDLKYKVFMINESMEGTRPDCRNFIAFPNQKKLPLKELFQLTDNSVLPAQFGNNLIEI